jgi:hypothetical protein
VDLIAPQLFGSHLLRRTTEVLGKLLHSPDVAADRIGRIVAPPEIVQHALTQSGHRNLLLCPPTLVPLYSPRYTTTLLRRASGLVLTGYPELTETCIDFRFN